MTEQLGNDWVHDVLPQKIGEGFATSLIVDFVSRPQQVVTNSVWHPTLGLSLFIEDFKQHELPEDDKLQSLPLMWKGRYTPVRVMAVGCDSDLNTHVFVACQT
ncbi:hypothetical protein ABBQ32_001149 [Trebouxia sp. C0010 RCD-2024]